MAILQEKEDNKVHFEFQRMEQVIKKDIEKCRMAMSFN